MSVEIIFYFKCKECGENLEAEMTYDDTFEIEPCMKCLWGGAKIRVVGSGEYELIRIKDREGEL